MLLRTFVSAALLTLTIAPAFAVTSQIRADHAAVSAAHVALHKDYIQRHHDVHALYLAKHHHDVKAVAVARHNIAMDNAHIRRDSAALHRAQKELHHDSVALHHPA
ncbi:MAG TPA: hypothetical protein VMV40_01100 [Acidiferrobacter sp.]|nr:hypothetical protein [Acidiferrobacter sp.]